MQFLKTLNKRFWDLLGKNVTLSTSPQSILNDGPLVITNRAKTFKITLKSDAAVESYLRVQGSNDQVRFGLYVNTVAISTATIVRNLNFTDVRLNTSGITFVFSGLNYPIDSSLTIDVRAYRLNVDAGGAITTIGTGVLVEEI